MLGWERVRMRLLKWWWLARFKRELINVCRNVKWTDLSSFHCVFLFVLFLIPYLQFIICHRSIPFIFPFPPLLLTRFLLYLMPKINIHRQSGIESFEVQWLFSQLLPILFLDIELGGVHIYRLYIHVKHNFKQMTTCSEQELCLFPERIWGILLSMIQFLRLVMLSPPQPNLQTTNPHPNIKIPAPNHPKSSHLQPKSPYKLQQIC